MHNRAVSDFVHRSVVASSAYELQNVPERGLVTSRDTFLPRDALLSAVYAVVVCLSVCVCVCVCVCPSTPVLYQNG